MTPDPSSAEPASLGPVFQASTGRAVAYAFACGSCILLCVAITSTFFGLATVLLAFGHVNEALLIAAILLAAVAVFAAPTLICAAVLEKCKSLLAPFRPSGAPFGIAATQEGIEGLSSLGAVRYADLQEVGIFSGLGGPLFLLIRHGSGVEPRKSRREAVADAVIESFYARRLACPSRAAHTEVFFLPLLRRHKNFVETLRGRLAERLAPA